MQNIYFAGSLFSEAERQFNVHLATELESAGFSVFLPQRDGVEATKAPYNQMTRDERRKAMFELDREQIFKSDVFLFVLDGRIPDEGACVELGMAYTHRLTSGCQRFIVGLQTDERAAFLGSKLNPMLRLCFDRIIETRRELLNVLRQSDISLTTQ